MGFVHEEGPDDCLPRFVHVLEDVREQAGLAGLWIRANLHRFDSHAEVARLNDGLHAIGKPRDDVEPQQRPSRIGPESRGGIRQPRPGGEVDHARSEGLHALLEPRKMRDVLGLAVRDDDVGAPLNNRREKIGDPLLRVLVVAVGVDDDVGAVGQRIVDAVAERPREALVSGVPDDVRDAAGAGRSNGAVRRSVVDDEDLQLVDVLDRAGNRLENHGKRRFFVETGYLDEDLHGCLPRMSFRSASSHRFHDCPLRRPAERRRAGWIA